MAASCSNLKRSRTELLASISNPTCKGKSVSLRKLRSSAGIRLSIDFEIVFLQILDVMAVAVGHGEDDAHFVDRLFQGGDGLIGIGFGGVVGRLSGLPLETARVARSKPEPDWLRKAAPARARRRRLPALSRGRRFERTQAAASPSYRTRPAQPARQIQTKQYVVSSGLISL